MSGKRASPRHVIISETFNADSQRVAQALSRPEAPSLGNEKAPGVSSAAAIFSQNAGHARGARSRNRKLVVEHELAAIEQSPVNVGISPAPVLGVFDETNQAI